MRVRPRDQEKMRVRPQDHEKKNEGSPKGSRKDEGSPSEVTKILQNFVFYLFSIFLMDAREIKLDADIHWLTETAVCQAATQGPGWESSPETSDSKPDTLSIRPLSR